MNADNTSQSTTIANDDHQQTEEQQAMDEHSAAQSAEMPSQEGETTTNNNAATPPHADFKLFKRPSSTGETVHAMAACKPPMEIEDFYAALAHETQLELEKVKGVMQWLENLTQQQISQSHEVDLGWVKFKHQVNGQLDEKTLERKGKLTLGIQATVNKKLIARIEAMPGFDFKHAPEKLPLLSGFQNMNYGLSPFDQLLGGI